jgi:hypothetical protein
MELHLKIVGWSFIALAFVHAIFPRYFNWSQELKSLSLINKQILQVHTFFIALTVGLMGLLCITSANELCTTILGKRVALGLCFFWCCRFVIQFVGYSSILWLGKLFETIVHIVLSIFWLYVTLVFGAAYWGN